MQPPGRFFYPFSADGRTPAPWNPRPKRTGPPGVLPKNPVKYKGKTSISNIRCDILEKVTSYDSKGKENLNASLQKFCTVR